MASALIETQNPKKPHKFNDFIGENFDLALNRSIQALIDSLHKPTPDLSVFASTFHELLQTRVNPPLEIIWLYSALTFLNSNSPKGEPLDRFSVTKELFHSITACSASCSSSKSIALIASVIYNVHRIIVDIKARELGSKREKKLMREIKSFVDVILGYINVCCCDGLDDTSDDLVRPLEDLVSVWIRDGVAENGGAKKALRLFFPLLSDDIVEWLSMERCVVSELAGVVIAEVFLLRFCLEFIEGSSRPGLRNELRTWAVGSITGFRNTYFFEILLRMLLEPTLPATSLLNFEDEILLRNVLYDAVILVEYSFLDADRVAHLPSKHIKTLAMSRLMVTHEAIELFREHGDQMKAISYINAFSNSHLPSQLVKWVTSEIGMEGKASGQNGSSPKAFLKWLVNLENRGIRLLDGALSKCHAKLVLENSKADDEQPKYKADKKKSATDLLFYIDNKGEEENREKENEKTNESMDARFVAAAQTMQSEYGGGIKRKEGRSAEKKKRLKFLKYNLYDNSGSSGEKSTFFNKDESSSGSEVENPLSDEDMEVKEQ